MELKGVSHNILLVEYISNGTGNSSKADYLTHYYHIWHMARIYK